MHHIFSPLDQTSTNRGPRMDQILMPNEVLLVDSHIHLFIYCLWLFQTTILRTPMTCEA